MGRRLRVRRAAAALLVSGLALVPESSIGAYDGRVTLVAGSGRIMPGLTTMPSAQSMTFSAPLTGQFVVRGPGATATTVVLRSASCAFTGASSPTAPWPGDDLVRGAGTFQGTCGGSAAQAGLPNGLSVLGEFEANCDLSYVRGPTKLHLQGGCSYAFGTSGTLTPSGPIFLKGWLAFTPIDFPVPSFTTYLMSGDLAVS